MSKKEEIERLINTALDNLGKVDILVNNAGITRQASLLGMNLKSAFLCFQVPARHMIQCKYGKIINITSIAGLYFVHIVANYCVSKTDLIQLTKVAARELGQYGVNVNSIAPGVFFTDMVYYQKTEAEVGKYVEQSKTWAALGRVGVVADIANVALFLASDESSFITDRP